MRLIISLAVLMSTAYSADFTTYIGDQNPYNVAAIATDPAGNTYVTGSRFIESAPASSDSDVFVTKLDATGNIVFTTTFGGKGIDVGNTIAVDPSGNIWVGGNTSSENFPLHDATQTALGSGDTGFLVELAPDGTVIYSSYFGGLLGSSSVNGIAMDQNGNLYLTGTDRFHRFSHHARPPRRDRDCERNHAIFRRVYYQVGCYGPPRPLLGPDCGNFGGVFWRQHLLPDGARHLGREYCPRCGRRCIDGR